MKYILAYDLGTSGNKASLYDSDGQLTAGEFYGYTTYYPQAGWVEQDPDCWWESVQVTTRRLLERTKVSADSIACVAFSGQMMGCVPVDRYGNALSRSIIWADQRALVQAQQIEERVGLRETYEITGHRVSPTYSAAKIMWLRDNRPDIYNESYSFLHAKDFVIGRLTGNFVTDYSDASGMNLLDIKTLQWSQTMLDATQIAYDKLPKLHASTDVVGYVTPLAAQDTGLKCGTPVVVGGGDGSCAAAGAGVVEEGMAYNYIGSSSWIGVASRLPMLDPQMRTFNWVHLDPSLYAPTGTMQAAGGSYSWLKDALCAMEVDAAQHVQVSPYEIMNMVAASAEPGARSLLYLPYLLGERSPHWNPNARGAFVGLTPRHTRAHIIRSVLEGITFNLRTILDAFREQVNIEAMRIIGGGAKGLLWRQIMADIYGIPIQLPRHLDEATSLGAAVAGGVGVGLFENVGVAKDLVQIIDVTHPRFELGDLYDELYSAFRRTYETLIPVFDQLTAIPQLIEGE